MPQLISIETVPISIEYVEKEHPSHHRVPGVSSGQTAQLRISQQSDRLSIKSNPISIPLRDTFTQSSSADWSDLSYTATAQYFNDGTLTMNVRFKSSNSGAYQFQQFNRGIENIIDFLPKTGDSSYPMEDMQINFDMSYLPGGGPPIDDLETDFLPPDLEVRVVEQPRVIIKYLGGPIYIPKSADPQYVEPECHQQLFDGKAALDVKA